MPAPLTPTWIVAHDFSRCAEAATALAVEDLAQRQGGGHIVLLNMFSVMAPQTTIDVNVTPSLADSSSIETAARLQVTRELERVAGRVREMLRRDHPSASVSVDVEAHAGAAAEGILDAARKHHADRIVVGTHGRTGLGALILGSVAERVVRTADVPVLVAHGNAEPQP